MNKVKKNVDFTNLKVKKRSVLQRIFDLKLAFTFFRKGMMTSILILIGYCLIYFNNLDFVRNIENITLEKFTNGDKIDNWNGILIDGQSSNSIVTSQKSQENLMKINTISNKDNFILWTWNFWYYLSQGIFKI